MTSKAGKKPREYYKLTNKQPKKAHKAEAWLKDKKKLDERVKVEGETKWLKNACKINDARLKKAGLL